jgi:hypothetical protein
MMEELFGNSNPSGEGREWSRGEAIQDFEVAS